jgi:hypothetical protein
MLRDQPEDLMETAQAKKLVHDSHSQLRSLYMTLLEHQNRFDEFKSLLAQYEPCSPADVKNEDEPSRQVRERLNARIRDWVDGFQGFSAQQVVQWRGIVVEERINVSLSPWKESNLY